MCTKSLELNVKLDFYSFSFISQSQEIAQSGNMDYKTPISFNLRKSVEKHCNGPQWVHSKTRKQGELRHDYIVPDLIDFFDND